MRQTWQYVEVYIYWLLVSLKDQVAVGANLDPQVEEDKAVNVTIASPTQAPPSVEAMEECIPGKR
jgi:hypothetical protein